MLKCLCLGAVVMLYFSKVYGDLAAIVDPCCEKGTEWAQQDDRCDNYPTRVSGVEDSDQPVCHNILEVCCLKSKQQQMCEQGKEDARESQSQCVIRDDEIGAATYKECCHCCRLGLMAREMGMGCEAPPIGNPCDLKFIECCSGISGTGPDESGSNTTSTDVSDINECEVFGGGQLCNQQCINTIGSFRCACISGYSLANDQRTCYRNSHVDTCSNRNPCDQGCVDTSRGPICTCREGFQLLRDRTTCRDIDECWRGMDDCHGDQECINIEGGFRCVTSSDPTCQAGYVYNPDQETCVPEGQAQRDCRQGYAFNTVTQMCEDIDECVVQKHDCYGERQMCENRRGSFKCRCEDGFMQLDRASPNCTDIDECARQMDECPTSQRCENTVGSYACRRITGCGTGYTLNEEAQTCVDQDECLSDTHNCGVGYECHNIEGSFRCHPRKCPPGSRFSSASGQCETVSCTTGLRPGVNTMCEDINECNENAPCSTYQTCINTYGSYQCQDSISCPPGLEVDPATGEQCIDIDECAKNTHDCYPGQTCMNRRGSYTCSCPDGYRNPGNGPCADINECQYGSVCPFNSQCVNTEGSFECTCNSGLTQEGRQCVDIDECQDQNMCQHRCINLVGSFQCACNRGYQLSQDSRSCTDIDECRQFGTLCAGSCTNTPGSYQCTCPEGWRVIGRGRSCTDINECEGGLDPCGSNPDMMCFNTRGGYKCPMVTCPSGFSRSDLGPSRNRVVADGEVVVEPDDILCRKDCPRLDLDCIFNKTTSVSYQFLALPTISEVKHATVLLNISAQGFALTPQFFLYILSGNEERLFDTTVQGDTAALRLRRPLAGPREHHVMLRLENRSYIGNRLLSAHNTHLFIDVSRFKY